MKRGRGKIECDNRLLVEARIMRKRSLINMEYIWGETDNYIIGLAGAT